MKDTLLNNLLNLPAVYFLLDQQNNITWVNNAFQNRLRFATKELINKPLIDVLDKDSRKRLEPILYPENFDTSFSGIPITILDDDKVAHKFTLSTAPFQVESDKQYLQCLLKDHTDINRLEHQHIKNQQLLFQVQEIANMGIMKIDLTQNVIDFDWVALDVLGLQKGEISSTKDFLSHVYHEDKREVMLGFNQLYLLVKKESNFIEFRFKSEEEIKWISLYAGYGPKDGDQTIIATVQNITLSKKREAAALSLKNTLELATDTASIGILEWDLIHNRFIGNKSLAKIFEIKKPNVDFRQFIYGNDRELFDQALSLDNLSRNKKFELRFKINVGRKIKYLQGSFEVLKNSENEPVKVVGALADRTEFEMQTLQMKNALQENHKLFRELHHRVKNNLQLISSILYLNLSNLKDQDDLALMKHFNSRILRMAKMHEFLFDNDNIESVDILSFLSSVATEFEDENVSMVVTSVGNEESCISEMPVESTMVLGGILMELLYNAVSYGIQKEQNNEVHVAIEMKDSIFNLAVNQPLHNIPDDLMHRNSLGVGIIKSFMKKINATIEVESNYIKLMMPASRERSLSEAGQALQHS